MFYWGLVSIDKNNAVDVIHHCTTAKFLSKYKCLLSMRDCFEVNDNTGNCLLSLYVRTGGENPASQLLDTTLWVSSVRELLN